MCNYAFSNISVKGNGSFCYWLILEFCGFFPAKYNLVAKHLFFFIHKILLSRTPTGNSGNFPSQIFRSPPFYLLPTGNLFFWYFLWYFLPDLFSSFLLNFCPLDMSQIFWLPTPIVSKWHLFHLLACNFASVQRHIALMSTTLLSIQDFAKLIFSLWNSSFSSNHHPLASCLVRHIFWSVYKDLLEHWINCTAV